MEPKPTHSSETLTEEGTRQGTIAPLVIDAGRTHAFENEDMAAGLEREAHVSLVLRLRQAIAIGIIGWVLTGAIDWMVVRYIHSGRLSYYFTLRYLVCCPIVVAA